MAIMRELRTGALALASGVLAVACLAATDVTTAPRATDFGPKVRMEAPLDGLAGGVEVSRGARKPEFVSGIKVLLVGADDGAGPLQAGLLGYGDIGVVDYYNSRFGTPSLAQLQAYNVVIEWCNYFPSNSTALGDVLADYVDAGGKVVMAVFNWNSTAGWSTFGRIMTPAYCPLMQTPNQDHYTNACLGIYQAGHPIMQGVSTACDFYRDYTALAPGATLVASWDDGENFVATQGCIVGINSYPGAYYQYSGDLVALYHNAVDFLYGGCTAFNKGFVDDYGRSQLCLSTKTGAYSWTIQSGPGSVASFAGTANVLNGGTKITSKAGDPNSLNFTFDPIRKKANGYFMGGGFYSQLKDSNTAASHGTCY